MADHVGVTMGERLFLRPIEIADIDRGWLRWINSSDVTSNLSTSRALTKDDLLAYYRDSQPPRAYMFAICENRDERYVGNARLSGVDHDNSRTSYGWFIGDPADRGKGYGTEALSLLVAFAFSALGLNRVSTSIRADNVASLKVNERVGFKREGILREYVCKDGTYYDAVQISLLRREFNSTASR